MATLLGDRAGTSAPVATDPGGTTLPPAIGSNESITILIAFLIAVKGLTSQGPCALDFSVGADGASPATLTSSDGACLTAPSPKTCTATACQMAAMHAHIPAASRDTYYGCPPAS